MQQRQRIAFIGGTGPEGLGLALRFASVGRAVSIGSRSLERAQEAAAKIKATLPNADVRGLTNGEAAESAGTLVITVPYEAQAETLKGLRQAAAGKTVIDTVVPLRFDKGAVSVVMVPEGSAAQQAAALLPEARVVAAFHHLSAPKLAALDQDVPGDVIVCGDLRGHSQKSPMVSHARLTSTRISRTRSARIGSVLSRMAATFRGLSRMRSKPHCRDVAPATVLGSSRSY